MVRLTLVSAALIFAVALGHAKAARAETILTLENVANFVLSPQRNLIAIINTDGSAYLWSTRDQRRTVDLASAQITYNPELVWSPDQRYVAASYEDGAHLWETTTGRLINSVGGHPVSLISDTIDEAEPNSHRAHHIAFSSDGALLATANELDSTVILHSVPHGEIIGFLQVSDPTFWVNSLTFGKDDLLAVGTLNSTEVWNVRTQQRLYTFPLGDWWMQPAFSPDNSMLAMGDGQWTSVVNVYDLATGEERWSFEAPLSITELLWTPDNRMLVGNFTDAPLPGLWIHVGFSIRSWNTDYGLPLNIFSMQSEQEVDVDLKPDEMLIGLSNGEYTNQVFVWNQQTGDAYHVRTSPETSRTYRFSTEPAYGIALNPNGSILTAGIGDQVVAWDLLSGQEITRINAGGLVIKTSFVDDGMIAILTRNNLLAFEALNHG
jgi:WD40 repeat protein